MNSGSSSLDNKLNSNMMVVVMMMIILLIIIIMMILVIKGVILDFCFICVTYGFILPSYSPHC